MAATNSLTFDFLARDRASKTFDTLSNKSDGLASKLSSFGGMAVRALGAATIAAGTLATAGLTMGIKTAAGLEQAEVGFTTLLGSAENARSFLGDLSSFAATTPFELPGLIDASRQLLGVGASAESVIPTLTAWGNASGALGISQEAFSRAMIAVTQSMAKGKVQAEELMQITEAGIPVYPLLAKALGTTVPELQEMASRGELLASEVFPALEAQMQKDYGGSMIAQSQTLNGLWSTFMDTLNIGLAQAIMPVQDELKGGLTRAIEIAGAAFEELPGIVEGAWATISDFADFVRDDLAPDVQAGFETVRDTATEVFNNFFGDVDFAAIGQSLIERAQALATNLMDGIRIGLETGDWGPLGQTVGDAIGQALINAANLTEKIIAWMGSVDWVGLGISVGAMVIPFAVGVATGFINALTDPAMYIEMASHWQEILLAAVGVVLLPAKWIASITKFLAKIPFVGKFVAWFFDGFVKISKAVLGRALKFVGDLFGALGKGIIGPKGIKVIQDFIKWLKAFPTGIGVAAINVAEAAGRMMGRLRDRIIGWAGRIGSAIGSIISKITSPFRNAASWLLGKGSAIMTGLKNGLSNGYERVRNYIKGLPDRIKNFFSNAGRWLLSAGKKVIDGFVDGIKSGFGKIKDALGWVTDQLPDWKGPPSVDRKILAPSGEMVMQGFVDGMRDMFPVIQRELTAFTGTLTARRSPIAQAASQLLNHITSGGRIYEDFSFVGGSPDNFGMFNDQLMDLWDAAGSSNAEMFSAQWFRDLTSWLQSFVRNPQVPIPEDSLIRPPGYRDPTWRGGMVLESRGNSDSALITLILSMIRKGELRLQVDGRPVRVA